MKTPPWLQLAYASTIALLACLFVCLYNDVGISLVAKHDTLKGVVLIFLKFQWVAFVAPAAGYAAVIQMRKSTESMAAALLSICLQLFAYVWPLIAVLFWQVQRMEIHNLIY